MTKDIKQIQEENRKIILEAIHQLPYEEALKKELGFGCSIFATGFKDSFSRRIVRSYTEYEHLGKFISYVVDTEGHQIDMTRVRIIFGKAITLPRILLTLSRPRFKEYEVVGINQLASIKINNNGKIFNWDLTKETLEEQSEETQRAVLQLLTGNE